MSWLALGCQVSFCFSLLLQLHFPVTFSLSSKQLCHQDESLALLQFKDSFLYDKSASINCETSYNSTAFWKLGSDCCLWDGVTCDNVTGQVIGLELSCNSLKGNITSNSSLFNLPHLERLNLAYIHFNYSRIPSEFGSFTNLTHLNLSSAMFSGLIPSEISFLSKLVSLDLSFCQMLSLDTPTMNKIVRNLTHVKELFLDDIDMSLVGTGSLANLSSSLISLGLSQSDLQGQFPESIFLLRNLQILDLTWNSDLYVSFPKSNWSSPLELLLVGLTNFRGELPESIEGLISLIALDLRNSHLTGSFPASLVKLQQLVSLDLSENNLAGQIPDVFSSGSRLRNLFLSNNNFSGTLPSSFFKLAELSKLDLSKNRLQGNLPYQICDLTSLTELHLSSNLFTGTLPSCLLGLPSLKTFDMNNNSLSLLSNSFSGPSPSSVFNLTQLDLSQNRIQGFLPHYICELTGLTYLDLSSNFLSGDIPPCFFRLPSLRFLYMNDNQLGGELGDFQSKSLVQVQMNGNKISGAIPPTIFELVNLTELLLSSNNLSGVVDLGMFSKLKDFWGLDLSFNRLSVITNGTWPQFYKLALSSCNISEFPKSLRTQNQLNFLSLSYNKIHGEIPKWFSGLQYLQYLDLSHNFLTSLNDLPINLQYLDLSSNFFQQPLPTLPQAIYIVLLANNNFTGEIPLLICNITTLQIIDLSNNSLSGTIPHCLANFSVELSVLNLGRNSFHGTIPGPFLDDNELRNLNLNGNQLEGSLPRSLETCKMLEVLDLGNNKINDSFPQWLEALPNLQVLVLRSNRLQGRIGNPETASPFASLRILDLSYNEFRSFLPTEYFKHLQAMMKKDEAEGRPKYMGELYYQDSVFLTVKGTGMELVRILTIFTTIDMSVNRFEGNIPEVIGNLSSLRILNFSHNDLTGPISSFLGNLLLLESLDLSSNMLEGGIPEELTNLNFLQVFNISYNRLSGLIPQGKQFNTFANDSYIRNMGLCGFPLSEKCSNDLAPQQQPTNFAHEDSSSIFDWKFSLMGYGCGLVIGLSLGYVVFSTGKPQWLAKLVERLEMKMYETKYYLSALVFEFSRYKL